MYVAANNATLCQAAAGALTFLAHVRIDLITAVLPVECRTEYKRLIHKPRDSQPFIYICKCIMFKI
jgi:hypothetical protein